MSPSRARAPTGSTGGSSAGVPARVTVTDRDEQSLVRAASTVTVSPIETKS